jgi:hypothetical protein
MIRRAIASDIPEVASLYHAVWHETQAPFVPAQECELRFRTRCARPETFYC